MADQNTSSEAKESRLSNASTKAVDVISPALIKLARLLARSAAIDTFEASSNSNEDRTDVKD